MDRTSAWDCSKSDDCLCANLSGQHVCQKSTPADALRVFAIREEMRWRRKARLHLEHNLRHPDRPLSLAAVGRIVQWGLESGRIKPCSFWCEGRAKARRRRSFAGGHAERWRGEEQAPGRPSGPHDPEHRRQGLQGVWLRRALRGSSGVPQDPPPARPGVLPRHLRRRQGVPRRGAQAPRRGTHPSRRRLKSSWASSRPNAPGEACRSRSCRPDDRS